MGKLACGCLNVKIHTKSEEIKSCDVAQLGINPPAHEFFSKQLAEVCLNLEGITTEHKHLLQAEKLCESWTVNRCLNCKIWTHANQSSSNRLLVNPCLSSTPTAIEQLEQSADFSRLYHIVLYPRNDNQPVKPLGIQHGKYDALQGTLTTIQQQLNKFLMDEEAAMENKIRAYEQLQRDDFAALQSKARRDKNTLISLMLASEEPASDATGADMPPPLVKANAPTKMGLSFDAVKVSSSPSPSGGESPVKPRSALSSMLQSGGRAQGARGGAGGATRTGKHARNIDDDDFDFDPTFDDTNDQRSFYVSDDDDETEDTDDSEPEVRIGSSGGRRMAPRSVYSSSVPITVPMWGAASTLPPASMTNRTSLEEEDEEDALPEHPEDMAASMKALARSVHTDGTEMFGDLPRSRFKTEFGRF